MIVADGVAGTGGRRIDSVGLRALWPRRGVCGRVRKSLGCEARLKRCLDFRLVNIGFDCCRLMRHKINLQCF